MLSALAALCAGAPAQAQTTIANAQTGKVTLTGGNTLEVTGTGSLSTGSDKAVTIKTPTAVAITVDAGGTITSEDDAITTKTIDTSVGTITITNNGTIRSTSSGQAIDLDDVSAPGITTTITNGVTGSIIADNADGVRPGANATVINSGLIYADGPLNESHDGVDFQSYAGTVINQSTGTISGQRHGITSDTGVNVTNYGTIIGRNGSGVGSDGTGTVVNYGTIIGGYNGSGTGDGDGVDIDGAYYIDNYGTIEAQGAAGYGSDGGLNQSEGVALTGGGTLINEASGTITSVDIGATICCTTNSSTVYNYGTIYGASTGFRTSGSVSIYNYGTISSGFTGIDWSDTTDNLLVNYGTVSGTTYGIAMNTAGSVYNIDNYGTISSDVNALYVDPGVTVNLTAENGSAINGGIWLLGALNLITPGSSQLAGAITGTGQLIKSGAGSLILTGDSSYSGGTTISAGTLQLGDGGTSGSITGDIVDNGVLAVDRSDTLTLAGVISGTGSLQQIGTGTTVLTGTNSYSGGTTISAGTLQLGNGGTSGSITGDIVDNGVLAVDRSDTLTLAGVISGSGSLQQIGTGTTTLTGSNSYSGGTTISAGTLQLGNGGTSGSIIGDVANNGVLAVDRSDMLTLAGVISGSGSLKQIGTGTTVLTGNNSYSGGTTISAGTLQLGNGGTSGSITGDIVDNGVLVIDRSNALTLAGVISGSGSLQQIGAGTTTLTGSNSYSGSTLVSAGILRAGAAHALSAASLVTVASGALLDAGGYSQTVAGLTNAGTVTLNAAASSAGATLTVLGNYTGLGGRLVLNTVLAAGSASADRLVIQGNATGSTTLTINNVGGKGGLIAGDGLELIEVDGTTQAGAFKLASTLTAGAFDYNIFQGGVGADAGNGNWYLRTAGYSTAAQSILPYASSLITLSDATLPSLTDRNGGSVGRGWWTRVVGQYGSVDPQDGGSLRSGVGYDQGIDVIQTGFSAPVAQGAGGRLDLGLYGTAGTSRVDIALTADPVTGAARGKARITTDAYGMGGTMTFSGSHGFYLDLIGQANLYRSHLGSAGLERNHGWSGTASAELGRKVTLANGWSLMPMLGASWTRLSLDSMVDGSGNAIAFDRTSDTKGSAGLRVMKETQWSDSAGHADSFTFHASGKLRGDFQPRTTLTLADDELTQRQKGLWAETTVGATYVWNNRVSVFAQATYAQATAGGQNNSFRPGMGLQARW